MGWHKNPTEAKRAHHLERCNHRTFAKEVDSWRGLVKPQPRPSAPAAAAPLTPASVSVAAHALSPPSPEPAPHAATAATATAAAATTNAATGAGDAAALQPGQWAKLGKKEHAAALAGVFETLKFKTKATATAHAGKMYAGALPAHAIDGKCVHSAHQIALAIKTAKVPGCDKLHHQVITRAKKNYDSDEPSPGRGRPPRLPLWFDEELILWTRWQRETFKVPVTKAGMLDHINRLVHGTKQAAAFEGGEVPMSWTMAFLDRNKEFVGAGANRDLEASRDTWTTSKNAALHYKVLAEQLCACGAADWNKDFDPKVPNSEQIYITHADLIMSFDETGFDMNQTKDGGHGIHTKSPTGRMKKRGGRQVRMSRYTLAAHTASRVTGLGGSLASGESIIPGFVFPGQQHDYRWCEEKGVPPEDHVPCSSIVDPKTHKKIPAVVTANGKGGMDNSMTPWLLLEVVLPTFEHSPSVGQEFTMPEEPAWRYDTSHPFCRSDTADETLYGGRDDTGALRRPPGSIQKRYPTCITDGHSSHLTQWLFAALQDLKAAGYLGPIEKLGFVLRPPHTTHVLQNEDVSNFPVVKPAWKLAKADQINQNCHGYQVLSRESWPDRKTGDRWKKKGLDFFDFFPMVKPCWDKGFEFVTNMEGWKRCGLRPYTACVYWRLLAEEAKAAELMEGLLVTLPDLDRETVRVLNAQSVMPAADAEEDEGDLDSTVGFTGQQQDDAMKINAKRLQLAEDLVTFLKAHPAGVNTDFKDAYASHFAAMKKVLAPKMNHRVVTASEQWARATSATKAPPRRPAWPSRRRRRSSSSTSRRTQRRRRRRRPLGASMRGWRRGACGC